MNTQPTEDGITTVTTFPFTDVILPVPIPQMFTYAIPTEMQGVLKIGARVIVPFGNKKILTGIVAKFHNNPPQNYTAKYILELLDEYPLVTEGQIRLFEWMASYYMCFVGEVMNVAIPSGLKISSESTIQLKPNFKTEGKDLTVKELRLIEALQEAQSLSYNEAANILEVKNIYHIIKSLINKDIVLVFEEVKERYQPKIVKKIRLTQNYISKSDLEKLYKQLEKYPKQLDVILFYLRHVPVFKDWTLNETGLEKSVFTEDSTLSDSALKTLIKNGILEEFEVAVSRFEEFKPDPKAKIILSEAQKRAEEQIMQYFAQGQDIVLLHGITGSGKTEIYIDLAKKVLASGSQVLFLLPEIALTTQIVARLKRFFGSQMGIYHSKFSDNERVEVWQGVVSGKYNMVVGVRSAIFLPFDNLGLIIVDEEHETSYKQQEPAPRYNARDMAMVIAKHQQCKVLLGSATPSIETYYHAKNGRYGLVQLKERFGEAQLPDIELSDLTQERKAKTMHGHFSDKLFKAIKEALERKEQVILFQNRRGYSPYMTCRECTWIPKCAHCAVSLTYHMASQELRCHYCGYSITPPRKCHVCGSTRMETIGSGTEKIEDDLKLLLPEANIQRMDLDTTRSKNAYQQIINDFEKRNIDVLVGTQMLSKGLDFDNVSLVGIFDADKMINFPDFRATERAFQIMTQVSGRAGRKDKRGKVIIQTANPTQEVLHKIIQNDYEGLYLMEIEERAYYNYPPFSRLIKLTIKHADKRLSLQGGKLLADVLSEKLGKNRVLGPEPPLINRIRNKYLHTILIKLEREGIDLKAIKKFIEEKTEDIITNPALKKIQVVIDVDPL
ncbi:MAG: primosomal protein N' [Microscillaceae bacterium]|nr:primosomal protein N' [Microscillaceae bacterium]MDW8460552.1 primosomal protein N' [Cytophagales bacterium]